MNDQPTQKDLENLKHIQSLGIASDNQMSSGAISKLLANGWIRQVWIGSYALTDAGKRILRATS